MKVRFLLLFVLSIACFALYFKQTKMEHPRPTNGDTYIYQGDEEGNAGKRSDWFQQMHKAAPDVDWKAIEYQNDMARYEHRVAAKKRTSSDCDQETLAWGALSGKWVERGSKNQAGSVFDTRFDAFTQQLYVISAGGTLFRGNLDGSNWEILNQDLQFTHNFFNLYYIGSTTRLVAAVGNVPHYSDDFGLTWTRSEGLGGNIGSARYEKPVFLSNGTIYVIYKTQNNTSLKLYKSDDYGANFVEITSFGTTDMSKYAIVNPNNTFDTYVMFKQNNNTTKFYKVNEANNELDLLNENTDFSFGETPCNIVGTKLSESDPNDPTIRFYCYRSNGNSFHTFTSEDFGATWIQRGLMPFSPWEVGLYNSISDENFLIAGGLECWRSMDAGDSWERINEWGDYYGNEETKLHADMMLFNESKTLTGEKFILVSNHGGLNISYNYLNSVTNIGMSGLNVSQYYCVRTSPNNPNAIFAGSQDQGFQLGFAEADDDVDFLQVISGDYGQIVFSNNGNDLWTVYPDGDVSIYENATSGNFPSAFYSIDSNHESVWLPPMMADPNPNSNTVYVGGGSATGGNGSYIIQLDWNGFNIAASNLDFDFRDASGGRVTAMAHSKINTNKWYVGTDNGRFFYSDDAGQNWDNSNSGLPTSYYLYGQAIWPSTQNDQTVYFAGTGYSNPGVMVSYDGGNNFEALGENMPQTLFYDLCANPDETALYAATEAGPYVYIFAADRWFDMSGVCAPNQIYWSVEYVEATDVVRFGTYGRGIWDFEVSDLVITDTEETLDETIAFKVYPNPVQDVLSLEMSPSDEDRMIEIFSASGQLILKSTWDGNEDQIKSIPVVDFSAGMYFVKVTEGQQVFSKQFVKK